MMDLPYSVTLLDCRAGLSQPARIVRLTRNMASSGITGRWWANLGISERRRSEERDHHWNWTKLVGGLRGDAFAHAIAVVTPDDQIQGALIYRLNGRSFLSRPSLSAHGERLATAPRNRDGLVDSPSYRGVGTTLIRFAVCHSYEVGLEGRMTLFSLPSLKTQEFYRRLGFQETGEASDGMMLYELTPESATNILTALGKL